MNLVWEDGMMNPAVARREPPDAIDQREFRRCLGNFGTGVAVMTTTVEGRNVGLTANSFSSLSLDPPMILWSIGRSSRNFDVMQEVEYFNVNILASSQVDLSQRFASKVEDKFEGVAWRPGMNGVPVIEGAVSVIECRTAQRIEGGDHVIIVGIVENIESRDEEPLVFVQGRYGIAIDHPSAPAEVRSPPNVPMIKGSDEALFFRLLFGAFYAMSERFEEHRRAEGLNLVQLRLLIGVFEMGPVAPSVLMSAMKIPDRQMQDELSALLGRGLLSQLTDGTLDMTEQGRLLRSAVARREMAFERTELLNMKPEDIAVARAILQTIGGQ